MLFSGVFISMELRQIIKEEIQKVTVEQQILADILNSGAINEAADFATVLQKVKQYATRGALTASIITSLMSSPAFSNQQKSEIKAAAGIQQSAEKALTTITPELRIEWNNFVDWISEVHPGGIGDKGADPTAQLVAEYQKANPGTVITPQNIQKFQADLLEYNNKWISLQKAYRPQGNTLSAPSGVDNRIGSITSKMRYPLVAFEYKGRMTDFGADIDAALKAFEEEQDNKPWIDPNLTPNQRFERNRALKAAGKQLPTVGDMKRANAAVAAKTASGTQTYASN